MKDTCTAAMLHYAPLFFECREPLHKSRSLPTMPAAECHAAGQKRQNVTGEGSVVASRLNALASVKIYTSLLPCWQSQTLSIATSSCFKELLQWSCTESRHIQNSCTGLTSSFSGATEGREVRGVDAKGAAGPGACSLSKSSLTSSAVLCVLLMASAVESTTCGTPHSNKLNTLICHQCQLQAPLPHSHK